MCFNVDIFKGPSQIEEAHAAYISEVQADENLHYTIGHIAPERMQYLVENGQWSWTHPSKPKNFVRDLQPLKRNGPAPEDLSQYLIRLEVCSLRTFKDHSRSLHSRGMFTISE